jgi:5-(carboxyamino)imidazole ribonucleotide synthase
MSESILPGATIGILGGGQLGRMTAMAARSLGYRIQVLDPDPACPASFVVDACFQGGWDDAWEAGNMARGCDVVTLEIEQISLASMEAARKHAPMRPGAEILAIVQDRIEQKNWLTKHGFPVGPYRSARSLDELQEAAKALGGPCFVKSSHGGYDGKGQAKIGFNGAATEDDVREAWTAVGERACVAERAITLEQEISVMVARSPRGEMKIFPAASNFHENQILAWSVIPATIPVTIEIQARKIAEEIADTLQLEGIMAIEMFLTKDGTLLLNEMAPRTHNSYHASERACTTGQFEQAVRAICNLPLGDVGVVQPAAIANLLGDVWLDGPPRFDAALAVPGVRLHLYEKERPRRGRKMGHLSGVGATPAQAVERVLEAARRL